MQALDQNLRGLAKKLSIVRFVRPSAAQAADIELVKRRAAENKLKNVMMIPRSATGWSVRMFVGGVSRYFAYFKTDYLTACRIADLLTYRIGPYRLKYKHTPGPDEYNFPPELAKADYENEPAVAELIDEIEKHLSSIGALNNGVSARVDLYESVMRLEQQVKSLTAALTAIMEKLQ